MHRILLPGLLLLATPAFAHARLVSSDPAANARIKPPGQIKLLFSEKLEPAFSSVEVSDANGARVDQGKPRISASTMRVGVKPLPPGTYRVRWQVLSVDTHTTEGNFTFRVGP